MSNWSSSPPRLSKSRYLAGLQCHKRLFFDVHSPELATKMDAQRRAILDMGTGIGELARGCFPDGKLVTADHRHSKDALEQTAAFLNDPTVPAIFEAAIQHEETFIRVDVLERVEPEYWRLIEVKASSRMKRVHLDDVAVQSYVLQGSGMAIVGSFLMHINRRYDYGGGELVLKELFSIEEVTEAVAERLSAVPQRLANLRGILSQAVPPVVEPDGHCHTPFECHYWDYCTKQKPDRWIYNLPGSHEFVRALMRENVETIDNIPSSTSLTILQQRMKNNVEWISPDLSQRLRSVQYPVHHLDFETTMPAIPRYEGTRPYQPLPVQWSNHIESADASLRHESYLCLEAKDPREELAVSVLESLGEEGSICVYSEYEKYVLKSLADAFPALRKDLLRLVDRLWDLLEVLQEHYYHPAFKGSFSMKSVLPALVPSLGYDDLEIREGASASVFYHRMVFVESDWVERQRIAHALHDYCARDTLGMVELRKALRVRADMFQEEAQQ